MPGWPLAARDWAEFWLSAARGWHGWYEAALLFLYSKKNRTKSKQQNEADDSSYSIQHFFLTNIPWMITLVWLILSVGFSEIQTVLNKTKPGHLVILTSPVGFCLNSAESQMWPNVWQENSTRAPLSHCPCRKMQRSVSGPTFIWPRQSKASSQPAIRWHSSFSTWVHHKALTKPKRWLYSTQQRSLMRSRKTASTIFPQCERIFLNSLNTLWSNRTNSSPWALKNNWMSIFGEMA